MSFDIIGPLQKVWEEVKQNMDKAYEIRPFWSEADLVHFIATQYQNTLHKEVSKDLVVHVSSSLIPDADLFGELAKKLERFLPQFSKNMKYKREAEKVVPDLIVHKAKDVSHLLLCAQVKLILGTNRWENILGGVRKDLVMMSMFKHKQICDEVAMLIAFSPQKDSPKQRDELRSIIDEWQNKEPILHIKRYNC